MATVKPIQNDTDYDSALGRIYDLMAAEVDSPEGCELDSLVTAVEEYESRTVDIGTPGLIAAIEFRMEQAGLGPNDLGSCFGSREDVLELLSGKRPITPSIANALRQRLGIPSESILSEHSVSG